MEVAGTGRSWPIDETIETVGGPVADESESDEPEPVADDEVGHDEDDDAADDELETVLDEPATEPHALIEPEPEVPDHLGDVAAAERLLDAVDLALVRLDEGTYGTCEICGDAMDDTYLEIDPTADRCERHLPLAPSA
jgi:RNA polymerase-binding transcription factor DksA